ncbi:MAG TPA: large-conductance mechanosensitive channel protein MscL [Bacillota bacterium]|nr:large-conductance mechanosensitive channel protein MscL [Bacillota bacterium]
MWKEFKEFALKGNMIDLAVGIIIGAAFGKIVSSLVDDLIMPLFGYLTSGMNFQELKFVMSKAVTDQAGNVIKPEAAILYGSFIQNVVDFLIIAFSIFIVVKFINKARRKDQEEAAAAEPPKPSEQELLTEIRDLMKNK